MSDYAEQRANMLDSQIRPNDVTDHRILKAMLTLPREHFVPASQKSLAYADRETPIEMDGKVKRRMMTPMALARLVQMANISQEELVLVVGCGAGYLAAVASMLAESVVAVESEAELVQKSSNALAELSLDNAVVVSGELAAGYPAEAPYDVIIINGAVEKEPRRLLDQLSDGGRLVAVQSAGRSGHGIIYQKNGSDISSRTGLEINASVLEGFEAEKTFFF